jgi:hypothetical protein
VCESMRVETRVSLSLSMRVEVETRVRHGCVSLSLSVHVCALYVLCVSLQVLHACVQVVQ